MLSRRRSSSVSKVQRIWCELTRRYIGPTPPVTRKDKRATPSAGTEQIGEFLLLSLAGRCRPLYRLLLMRFTNIIVLLLVGLVIASRARAEEEEGFTSLFNGRDLGDWVNVNCAPSTWSVREG